MEEGGEVRRNHTKGYVFIDGFDARRYPSIKFILGGRWIRWGNDSCEVCYAEVKLPDGRKRECYREDIFMFQQDEVDGNLISWRI